MNEIIKTVTEILETQKKLSDHNVALYNEKFKDDKNFYLWEDESGFNHILKLPSCPICKFCSDIFIDTITTEIYCCTCKLYPDADPRDCERFEMEVNAFYDDKNNV